MIVGVILLVLGGIFLLKSLGIIQVPLTVSEIFLPLLMVIVGLYLILWSMRIRKLKEYKKKLFQKHKE